MPDVFISYSRKDKTFVQQLDAKFKASQRDVWVDWEDIPLAADWRSEIHSGIESADNFVFVISPDSVASEVCSEELIHAIEHNKRLVPVLYREVKDYKALNENISSHNWIYFRETDDFETAFNSLIKTIDTDLDHVRVHTRLLTRAVEWENKGKNASFLLRGVDLQQAE